MDPVTLQLILSLIPLAEKLVFSIGDKVVEMDTTKIESREQLLTMLEDLKNEPFPELKFISTKE